MVFLGSTTGGFIEQRTCIKFSPIFYWSKPPNYWDEKVWFLPFSSASVRPIAELLISSRESNITTTLRIPNNGPETILLSQFYRKV